MATPGPTVTAPPHRALWPVPDGWAVEILDQTRLPHERVVRRLETVDDVAEAIRTMRVRGAPLIGIAAAYGLALALRRDPRDPALDAAVTLLAATRPTAVNLRHALEDVQAHVRPLPAAARAAAAVARAEALLADDLAINYAIGEHGVSLLRDVAARVARPVNVLTHCNAGWLATAGWGTALAPVYRAHADGVALHVWVDETRPRMQGALTAWELAQDGVPHTVVADNAGGHLMQRGLVDLVLVGTDRTTAAGDVCNKVGTYLKALSARDTGVPFYAAVPGPSIDWRLREAASIPIEERDVAELVDVTGRAADGRIERVRVLPAGTSAANYAFDVTPARLVTGIITERGVCAASPEGLAGLYPERAA